LESLLKTDKHGVLKQLILNVNMPICVGIPSIEHVSLFKIKPGGSPLANEIVFVYGLLYDKFKLALLTGHTQLFAGTVVEEAVVSIMVVVVVGLNTISKLVFPLHLVLHCPVVDVCNFAQHFAF
jgi:hypothetical protein